VGEGAVTVLASASRVERSLMLLTPALAMAAVALGLRLGAPEGVRAALVYGAPPATARAGLAWSVAVFDESGAGRDPAAGVPIDVVASTSAGAAAPWHGVTDGEGVAEAWIDRAPDGTEPVDVEVRSGDHVLARGTTEPVIEAPAQTQPTSWQTFARREGTVALDVALLGERAAPGFPAELWVRATDASTHAPVVRATIAVESEGLAPGATVVPTDARGWTRVVVTPVGLAVTATIRARAGAAAGTWIGGVTMAPGAPAIAAAARFAPGDAVTLDVTMPTVRPTAYVEIDDARGRAWAAAVPLAARRDGTSHAAVAARALAPGLYWAVASTAPGSVTEDAKDRTREGAESPAGEWPPASRTIPFFVASTDDAAMAFGTDAPTCAPPADPRETATALGACLALSATHPVRRWVAIDGFAAQRAVDRRARAQGLVVALGAIALAILLEGALLVRAASRAGHAVRLADEPDDGDPENRADRAGRAERAKRDRVRPLLTVAVAVLVGLLGLTLLAAFILRV
jgi:hypothetical protein